MSDSDLHVMGEETEIPHTSPENAAKAARVAARFAQSDEERAEFLAMLGLVAPEECATPGRLPGDGVPVPNIKAREHIETLIRDHNTNAHRIARAAGLSHVTIAGVMGGTTSYRSTIRAILAVTPEACTKTPRSKHQPTGPRGQQVPTGPVREHVESLRRTMTVIEIATESGVSEETIRTILRGKRPYVTGSTAKAILAIPLEVSA